MSRRRSIRQLLIGLVALPLSLLPFAAYMSWTPEGRLVRDRALVAVNPPTLPRLSPDEIRRGVVPRYEGAVMLLAYHGIGSASDAEGGFVLSPERFGEHLVAMRKAGLNAVTAAQVADAFAGGTPLPPRAVMITFDDGRTDAMLFADPLLDQAGMKATMFVITSAADEPGVYYAGWDRLETAAKSGRWDLQSHTADAHRFVAVDGRELPALTARMRGESLGEYRSRVRRDFARADTSLRAHTGDDPVAVAYPFGAYGADRTNDTRVRAALRSEVTRRYALGFHQDEQESIPLATPFDDRAGLRRLEVGDWSPRQLMRRIASSADRTAAAVAARQSELQAEGTHGDSLPAGVTEQPGPPRRVPTRPAAAARSVAAPPPAAATGQAPPPTPEPVVAAPPAAPSQPEPPPSEPPPPEPEPEEPTPPPSDDAPGKSGDPHGNGRGPDKPAKR